MNRSRRPLWAFSEAMINKLDISLPSSVSSSSVLPQGAVTMLVPLLTEYQTFEPICDLALIVYDYLWRKPVKYKASRKHAADIIISIAIEGAKEICRKL
jgi:hypothetical protein